MTAAIVVLRVRRGHPMGRTGKVRAVVGLGLLAFVLAPAVLEEVFTPVGNITKLPHFRVSEGAMRTLASSRQ